MRVFACYVRWPKADATPPEIVLTQLRHVLHFMCLPLSQPQARQTGSTLMAEGFQFKQRTRIHGFNAAISCDFSHRICAGRIEAVYTRALQRLEEP